MGMDPLKLLSRSTTFSKKSRQRPSVSTPSSGQNVNAQLPSLRDKSQRPNTAQRKKRKREDDEARVSEEEHDYDAENFFQQSSGTGKIKKLKKTAKSEVVQSAEASCVLPDLPIDQLKSMFKQAKLKVIWLNAGTIMRKGCKRKKDKKLSSKREKIPVFPQPISQFSELQIRYDTPRILASKIINQGYSVPTETQFLAIPLLLAKSLTFLPDVESLGDSEAAHETFVDLLTVAPTGSGKTLAFLIPLLQRLMHRKTSQEDTKREPYGLILAPTKELVAQIVNEGKKLIQRGSIRIAQVRKGMNFEPDITDSENEDIDEAHTSRPSPTKADILVATPGVLQSLLSTDDTVAVALASIRCLVLDEADVLLDPMFREQTLAAWNHLTNPHLRVSLWSATMGSNIEEITQSTIKERRKRLSDEMQETLPEAPLIRLVVGLKDSAVPHVHHKLVYAATEQGKLMGLRQLIHPTSRTTESDLMLRPPFLIFTQTIERAIALHSELMYDIPPEAGGISRIAVLHSGLSDSKRDNIMTRFRKGEVWILITTDLLSRGVDFRGINGVVNYDLPTSSASYVHRVGRTGRAGRSGGIAVTFVSAEDVPYLKHVANVVSKSQAGLGNEGGVPQWLLDSLPKLSKNEKQKLKKRGIESRTARAQEADPKAARRSRISTKAGYVRRHEQRKKGAIEGSRRRMQKEVNNESDEGSMFDGFD